MQVTGNYQEVKLTPLPGDDWQVTSPWGNGQGNGHYPRFKMDTNSGAHLISFEIVGGSGPNDVTFQSVPIGVSRTGKPAQGAGDPQIVWRADASGKKLWVVDWNDNDASLGNLSLNYVLFVNNHKPLDPIIDNGGSIKPPSPPPPPPPPTGETAGKASAPATGATMGGIDWSALIIGLVIGLAIGLMLCWWRRKMG